MILSLASGALGCRGPDACAGVGVAATFDLGQQEEGSFNPYSDGDEVMLVERHGALELPLHLRVRGLNLYEPITVVMSAEVNGTPLERVAQAQLTCDPLGYGHGRIDTVMAEADQGALAEQLEGGVLQVVDAVAIDAQELEVEAQPLVLGLDVPS